MAHSHISGANEKMQWPSMVPTKESQGISKYTQGDNPAYEFIIHSQLSHVSFYYTTQSYLENYLFPTESNCIHHIYVTSQSLRICLVDKVEQLQKHDKIPIVIEDSNNNMFRRKKEHLILRQTTTSEIARWVREGNGFVVKLHSYIQKKEIQIKDI